MEQKNKSKDLILGALDQAADGFTRFKKTQLSEIFDEIGEFRARGLSRKQITTVLSKQGLHMTEGVFASTMSRIKKERMEREVKATEKKVVVAERKQVTNNEAYSEGPAEQKVAVTVKKQALEKVETKNTTGISREEMITMTNIPVLTDRKFKPQKKT